MAKGVMGINVAKQRTKEEAGVNDGSFAHEMRERFEVSKKDAEKCEKALKNANGNKGNAALSNAFDYALEDSNVEDEDAACVWYDDKTQEYYEAMGENPENMPNVNHA